MSGFQTAAYAVLFLFIAAGSIQPFIALWERGLAASSHRSLYAKSAAQVESLSLLLQLGAAAALWADLLCGGRMAQLCGDTWLLLLEIAAFGGTFAALCALAGRFMRNGAKKFFGLLSGMAACAAGLSMAMMVWAWGHGSLPLGSGQCPAFVFAEERWARLALFMISVLFAFLCAAYASALCWHIVCRTRQDYGRDFYSFVLKMRGKQAVWSGLLFLAASAAFSVVSPLSAGRASQLFPCGEELTVALCTALLLALPLAVACWHRISRSERPLALRSLAFFSLFLLAVGVFALLVRV